MKRWDWKDWLALPVALVVVLLGTLLWAIFHPRSALWVIRHPMRTAAVARALRRL